MLLGRLERTRFFSPWPLCFFFLFLAQIEILIARRNQEHPPKGNQRKTLENVKKLWPSWAWSLCFNIMSFWLSPCWMPSYTIWTNQPIHSFLVGCLKPCLQEINIRVGSPQPNYTQLRNYSIYLAGWKWLNRSNLLVPKIAWICISPQFLQIGT